MSNWWNLIPSKSHKQENWVVINGAERANITNCLLEEKNTEKTWNEGDIQLKNCKTEIEDTIVKKKKGRSIVELDFLEFWNLKLEILETVFYELI